MGKNKNKDQVKKLEIERNIHLQNYRMAFDAMRAYHTSEIEHKKDAISVLNAFLASMVPVFGGVFFYILKDNSINWISIVMGILSIVAYFMSIDAVIETYKQKVDSDHYRYEQFRDEANREREVLGIKEDLKEYSTDACSSLYWDEKGRERSGHNSTKNIIERYSMLLKGVCMFVAVLFGALIYTGYMN